MRCHPLIATVLAVASPTMCLPQAVQAQPPAGPVTAVHGQCDTHIEKLRSSAAGYRSWVDWQAGPQEGNRRAYIGVRGSIGDADRCVVAIMAAIDSAGRDRAFRQHGRRFATTLSALTALVNRASEYYEDEAFRDDGLQLGRQLHPDLVAGYERFSEEWPRFLQLLRQRRRRADQQLLRRLHGQPGAQARALVEQVRIAATELDELSAMIRFEDGHIHNPPRDALTSALARLNEARDGLQHALQNNDQVHAALSEQRPSSLLGRARTLSRATRELLRLIRRGSQRDSADERRFEASNRIRAVDSGHRSLMMDYRNLARAWVTP